MLNLREEAEHNLEKLNRQIAERTVSKILWFARNFERQNPKALTGELKGLFKLRAGDWRVIYSIDYGKQILTVHFVGHCKDIYR